MSNGGSRDTEVKELAVNPVGRPSPSTVVITVTPVMNDPNAFLSSLGSSDMW